MSVANANGKRPRDPAMDSYIPNHSNKPRRSISDPNDNSFARSVSSQSLNTIDNTIQLLTQLRTLQSDLDAREQRLTTFKIELDARERLMNEQFAAWQSEKQQLEARVAALEREKALAALFASDDNSSDDAEPAADEIDSTSEDSLSTQSSINEDTPLSAFTHSLVPPLIPFSKSHFSPQLARLDPHDAALLAQYDALSIPAITCMNDVPILPPIPAESQVKIGRHSESQILMSQPGSISNTQVTVANTIIAATGDANRLDLPENSAFRTEFEQMIRRIDKQRNHLESNSPVLLSLDEVGFVEENHTWRIQVARLIAGYPSDHWNPVTNASFKVREKVHFLLDRKWCSGVVVGVAKTDEILAMMQSDHGFAASVQNVQLFPMGGLLLPLASFSHISQLPSHHRFCYAVAKKSNKTIHWYVEPMIRTGWLKKDTKAKDVTDLGVVTPPKLMLAGQTPRGFPSLWPPALSI